MTLNRQSAIPSGRLTKAQRLRQSSEFKRCYDHGMRAGDDHLLLFALPNSSHDSRFGVSVSKRHGDAVRRNRKKRLLREAFRLLQHQLPTGVDLVLVPRYRPDSRLMDYKASLIRLAEKLRRRLHSGKPVSPVDGDPP